MCGIYCVYKQSRYCQLPFCASPIFHFEMEIFPFTCIIGITMVFVFSPYIRKLTTCFQFHVNFTLIILQHRSC